MDEKKYNMVKLADKNVNGIQNIVQYLNTGRRVCVLK